MGLAPDRGYSKMDQFKQREFKIGEGQGAAFGGGVITFRDEPLLEFGQFSVMENVKKWYPGISKRGGMVRLHTEENPTDCIS